MIIPVGDEKKMAEAMVELLTDKKLCNYFAQKSLERVRVFSEEKMLKKYKELILSLVKKQQIICG
jgi:glycosyltransferase involved in cell wall biosynthesis